MENIETLETYITPIDKEKIPKKKMNFKELLYRKRIKYGKYIDMGLVNDKVKFYIKDGNIIYQIDERNINEKKEEESNEKLDLNSKYLKALYYCSELDFSVMPSKREIKLRKMLNERIEKYRALINKNKKESKENEKDNDKEKDKDKEKEA